MPSDKPKQRPGLVVERAGHEIMVYSGGGSVAEGAVHSLNPTAALIWDLCDGAHSLTEIEQAVRQAFAVPAARDLAADVRQTLDRFRALHLLEN